MTMPLPLIREKRRGQRSEREKENVAACQTVSGRLGVPDPGYDPDRYHGFWPMVQAFIMSLQTGSSANLQWNDPIFNNYTRMFSDKVFMTSVGNTFLYLIIQVPIMLVLAILLAQLLNNHHLRFKGFFRTCVFLPCATALVSYALIFKSLFATDGLINAILVNLGILEQNYNFLGHPTSAKAVIILALIWRWTGYNMVFYLAGLQNIEYSVYEAAKIDGANGWQTFWRITVPLLRPTIVMTFIMSINGTLQLFDESVNLTTEDRPTRRSPCLITFTTILRNRRSFQLRICDSNVLLRIYPRCDPCIY